ncbi:MAG: DUF29 domain-containing protein [Bryobacteraceae bacterium]|nr:DUF29 domain-containing protein [Bryobacteraceae bacterium]
MPTVKDSYETDFFEWTRETAEKIRQGSFSAIDLETLAEEVESLGSRDQREALRRLFQLLLHLLKWRYQAEYRKRVGEASWRQSIDNQRDALERIFVASPSLRRFVLENWQMEFGRARKRAASQTGLSLIAFPTECQWTLEQILDEDFFPED